MSGAGPTGHSGLLLQAPDPLPTLTESLEVNQQRGRLSLTFPRSHRKGGRGRACAGAELSWTQPGPPRPRELSAPRLPSRLGSTPRGLHCPAHSGRSREQPGAMSPSGDTGPPPPSFPGGACEGPGIQCCQPSPVPTTGAGLRGPGILGACPRPPRQGPSLTGLTSDPPGCSASFICQDRSLVKTKGGCSTSLHLPLSLSHPPPPTPRALCLPGGNSRLTCGSCWGGWRAGQLSSHTGVPWSGASRSRSARSPAAAGVAGG